MQEKQNPQVFTIERKIGPTTYIVNSHFNENAREDATSKVVWLAGKMLAQKINQTNKL